MSFKSLKIGRAALRRVRIGRAALVAAVICVATARNLYVRDDGLYAASGLMIIVR